MFLLLNTYKLGSLKDYLREKAYFIKLIKDYSLSYYVSTFLAIIIIHPKLKRNKSEFLLSLFSNHPGFELISDFISMRVSNHVRKNIENNFGHRQPARKDV